MRYLILILLVMNCYRLAPKNIRTFEDTNKVNIVKKELHNKTVQWLIKNRYKIYVNQDDYIMAKCSSVCLKLYNDSIYFDMIIKIKNKRYKLIYEDIIHYRITNNYATRKGPSNIKDVKDIRTKCLDNVSLSLSEYLSKGNW